MKQLAVFFTTMSLAMAAKSTVSPETDYFDMGGSTLEEMSSGRLAWANGVHPHLRVIERRNFREDTTKLRGALKKKGFNRHAHGVQVLPLSFLTIDNRNLDQGDMDANLMCQETDDNARNEMWVFNYFTKWGYYPIDQMNTAANVTRTKVIDMIVNDNEAIGVNQTRAIASAMGIDLTGTTEDSIRDEIRERFQSGLDDNFMTAFNYFIGANVAGAAGGRAVQGAAVSQAVNLAGSQALRAFNALQSPGADLARVVVSTAVGDLTEAFVSDDYPNEDTVVAAASAGAGILTAIAIGAMTAGPAGAGAAAAFSSVQFLGNELINSYFRTFKGPDDNWCYVYAADLHDRHICAAVYAGDDTWRVKSYQNRNFHSNQMDYFSAGNDQDEKFQVAFYRNCNGWRPRRVWLLHDVYYQDSFFLSVDGGKLVIVYARGGVNTEKPGTTERREFDLP